MQIVFFGKKKKKKKKTKKNIINLSSAVSAQRMVNVTAIYQNLTRM